MKYISSLVGKNGVTYEVEIIDGDASEQQELTMVAGGLIVRHDGGDDLFTPLRGGSASITVLTDTIFPFLYNPNPMGTQVRIYDDSEILFLGYVTPSVYSAPFKGDRLTELTIECRDALSVLSEIDFDSPNEIDNFEGLINMAYKKVTGYNSGVNIIEPYDIPMSEMSVIKANWYDEGNEPMKWSEVLSSILQYCNCRLFQWRSEWFVQDFRQWDEPIELDYINCNASPTMSLTEVQKKVKVEVSLYEDGDELIDAFKDWKEEGSEEYLNDYFNSEKGDAIHRAVGGFLMHYSSPNITQYMYPDAKDLTTYTNVVRSGDAMAAYPGAWLVTWADDMGENAQKYIVLTTPHQDVPWRDSLLNNTYKEPYTFPALTLKDPVRRIFRANQMLMISGKMRMSSIPAPFLVNTPNELYNAENGKTYDYSVSGHPQLYIRARVGDKVAWQGGYAFHGWGTEALKDDSTFRLNIDFGEYNAKNPFQKDYEINSNSTGGLAVIGGDGYRIPLEEGLEGNLEIDIFLYSGQDTKVESLWISDFKVSLGYHTTRYNKFIQENSEKADIVYENETDDMYSKPYEVRLLVSTPVTSFNYSRSAVYQYIAEEERNAPIGELESQITGDSALAEHHLLNAIALQTEEPRMVLEGTWREHMAHPIDRYYSENLQKTFLVSSIEIDCDNSTSTMKLEEIV